MAMALLQSSHSAVGGVDSTRQASTWEGQGGTLGPWPACACVLPVPVPKQMGQTLSTEVHTQPDKHRMKKNETAPSTMGSLVLAQACIGG